MALFSVVIPAYNEEDGIRAIMQRVLAVRPEIQAAGFDDLELIVVDDGSGDHTAALVAAEPGVRLIRHAKNAGYGAALKTGFAAATGEWIGFLDADGTYPPEYFPRLCAAALAQDADIVIGSRMAGADSEMPRVRRLGNLIFARLVSVISARHITDSASGMRVFKQSILPDVYPLPDGLNLTPVMSMRALHENLVMVEEPIPYSERVGRSKLSVVRDGMRFGQSIVWTALYYNPVRPLGMIGLAALLLAAAIGLGLIFVRAQGVHSITPTGAFVLFAGLVLAVGGISIVALGVSFNYFVALFHRAPVRQGLMRRGNMNVHPTDHFGWVGLVAFALGVILGLASLVLGVSGWTLLELWLYYLTSACLALVGIQLMIAWIQIQVLKTLSAREALIAQDLRGKETVGSDVIETGLLQPRTA